MTITWKQVKEQLRKADAGKHDILVDPHSIKWLTSNEDFRVQASGEGPFDLSEWAASQLCSRLGIPVKYFRNCPPELKKMQVEFLVNARCEPDKCWRLRLKNHTIRGIVSGTYQPFDNKAIASVWEQVGQCDQFKYESLLDDTTFFLRTLMPNGADAVDRNGGILSGFYIRNSEVGRSGIWAGPIVYRLVCSNGLVVADERESFMYKRHIWIGEPAIAAMLNHAMTGSIDLSRKTAIAMEKARSIPIDLHVLVLKLDELELQERLKQQAVNSFLSEGHHNMFGMVNALTAAARELPPSERFGLEKAAGLILAEAA